MTSPLVLSQPSGLPAIDSDDRVDRLSPIMERQREATVLCRDVFAGTQQIRSKTYTYLPRHPAEEWEDYALRLQRSIFFNAFARTVRGLAGLVFKTDPEIGDDVPAVIVEHWENLDNAGTHGDLFARRILEDVLQTGFAGILVDYPKVEQPLTLADEQAMRLRPYWRALRKDDVLGGRFSVENGQIILDQIRLKEIVVESQGRFREREVERYRVIERRKATKKAPAGITWELYKRDEGKNILVEAGVFRNQSRIPVVLVYAGTKIGELEAPPPLLDLAYTNVAHYQVQSDHLTALHKASVPVFVTIGLDQGTEPVHKLTVGPNSGLSIPMGGDAKYVEHSGEALGQTRQALEDLKSEMAIMGLAMLSPEKRAAETAEAKRLDKTETDSALSVIARNLQDGIEGALARHAEYLGLRDQGGSIVINRDFQDLTLMPQEIESLSQLVLRGQLSLDSLWTKLAEGNALAEDFDPELERDRLEQDMVPARPGNATSEEE